jgi:phosphoribosylformylglycinamidine synthase
LRRATCTWPSTDGPGLRARDKFAALLDLWRAGHRAEAATSNLVVTPRLGTVSPWASKATDIAHNCGLVCTASSGDVEYTLALKRAA